ncbi:MAG TPA: FG-GAP-like repeat-containing protein [Planctomycetota bacterium]|nr:FG-GAP-like repeat-containing protein [Planctomycetota bacterium]
MTLLRVCLGLLFASLLAARPAAVPPFTEVSVGLGGVEASEVRWGDYNNDGLLDLLVEGFSTASGSRFIRVYKQNGGVFTEDPNDAGLLGLQEGPCIWGDLDNDGDLDFAYTGWSGGGTGSRIVRNNGAGGFAELPLALRGLKGADGVWFDYDNDGDLDLLLTGESYDPPQGDYTTIYRNDGNGVFTPAVTLPGTYVGEVSVGDFDRDGDYDIAITGRTVGTRIYRNDGNGVFTDIGAGLPAMVNCSIAWGDYDNDGDLDLVLSGDGPSGFVVDIYRNDNGTFVPINAGLPLVRLGHLAWGDYDNDGLIDLVMVGGDAALNPIAYVYRNNGNGTFSDAGAGLTPVWNQNTCDWGDYDNDGKLDIVLAGVPAAGPSVLKVFRNVTGVANTAPSIPAAPSSSAVGNNVTFHWTASSDAQTPAAALTYNLRVGTTPGGQQIMAPMANLATGQRRIPARGNAQQNLAWTLKNLKPGTYYWSVQAIDNGYLASGWSAEQSVSVGFAPTVTAMSPTPGSTLLTMPNTITLTLNRPPDQATVTASTVRVVHAGADNILGTGDDVPIVVPPPAVVGSQILITFPGGTPNGPIRVILSGTSVANPAPIARWSMDEGSGSVAFDSSGHFHDGALVNSPTWSSGKVGGGLHFNGVDQYVSVPDSNSLSPHVGPTGEMSVSGWIQFSSIPSNARQPLICKGSTNNWEYELTVYPNANAAFNMVQSNSVPYAEPRGGTVSTGVWHHLAGTMKKGVSVKAWLDGALVDTRTSFSGDTTNLAAPLHLGRIGPLAVEFLNGYLDEIQVFDKELSPAQVLNLATLGGAVRDGGGFALDGEFGGGFPSGDGTPGGDFVADFTLAVPTPPPPPPTVTTTAVDLRVGGCGATGLELLLLLAVLRHRR